MVYVKDLPRMRAFYGEMLGVKPSNDTWTDSVDRIRCRRRQLRAACDSCGNRQPDRDHVAAAAARAEPGQAHFRSRRRRRRTGAAGARWASRWCSGPGARGTASTLRGTSSESAPQRVSEFRSGIPTVRRLTATMRATSNGRHRSVLDSRGPSASLARYTPRAMELLMPRTQGRSPS